MKGQAALLLFLLAVGFASSSTTNDPTTTTTGIPSTRRSATNLSSRNNVIKKIVTNSEPIYSTLDNNTDSEVSKILSVDPKKILVENNRSEDEDANKEKVYKYRTFFFQQSSFIIFTNGLNVSSFIFCLIKKEKKIH